MKYQEFLEQVNRDKIEPVYFFTGQEEYLKKEALQILSSRLVAEEQRDFNYVLLYGKETSATAIIDQAQSLPFLAERRLVVVQEIEKLNDKTKLLEYIENPNPQACLVLVAGTLDGRHKRTEFFQALKKYEVVCWPLYENELKKWIEQKFRRQQKKITAEAVIFLIENVGTNLTNLDSESEKLMLSLPAQSSFSVPDLQKFIFRLYGDNAVRLEKYVSARQLDRALVALQDLFGEGEQGTYALWILASLWRKLMVAKEMQEQQATLEEITQRFNIKKFDEKRDFAQNLSKHQLAELVDKHKKIADTDLAIKSGSQDPLWALEHLVIELCR